MGVKKIQTSVINYFMEITHFFKVMVCVYFTNIGINRLQSSPRWGSPSRDHLYYIIKK